jgi:CheY-like chemotaxis protein
MKQTLLMIDSDKQLNKVNEQVLRSSGLVKALHMVDNGREALDYLKHQVEQHASLPNIIIFELQMSIVNGFEFIDQFRMLEIPEKEEIELVVFTASSKPSDKQAAIAKGIRHYLNKPYLLRALRDIIFQINTKESTRRAGGKQMGFSTIL